jgi:glycosyltransferase involved in cell wall biosynthesis
MRFLLVIDHLGLGGAQRQFVELACGLVQRGHAVAIFNYFPEIDYFRARVLEAGITVHDCRKGRGYSFRVLRSLAALIRTRRFDLVVSYLNTPNVYSELANLPGARGTKLVVSERSSHHDDQQYSYLSCATRRLLHGLSDQVVANSMTHAEWLRGKPWLRNKVACIYNGLDLDYLRPAPLTPPASGELRLLAVGRLMPSKNPLNLIQALQLFQREHGYVPQVSWGGKTDSSPAGKLCERQVHELLDETPEIRRHWRWLGERLDMRSLLSEHHALIHPSLYEGLPNAVCEALAVGMPVLVSAVCDHALLVADGERGFTFDPNSPRDMAAAIAKLAGLPASGWGAFARNARRYAEDNLSIDRMVTSYEQLALRLTGQQAA